MNIEEGAQTTSQESMKRILLNEWRDVTLGEFSPLVYGRSLPTDERNPMGNVPVVGSNGTVGYHDEALTEGPTIVIGRKGTVGAVHYIPIPCWPIDTTFFVTENDSALLRYKYYALRALGLDQMNSDSAVPGLNRSAAHARMLRVPIEYEQRAIAHVLGTLDDKIELNRRMNETLEKIARALFRSWFVNFEPVRAKMEGRWRSGESLPGLPADLYDLFPDHLVPSELGDTPEGWEVKSLEDCASLNPESWSDTNPPGSVEYVDLGNTKWGTIESTQDYLWESAPSRAKRVLRAGDTIVGTVRPGNGSYSLIGTDGLTGSTGFAVLRPDHPRYREFTYLAATRVENIDRLATRADGAAYPAVRPSVVSETEVVQPRTGAALLSCFSTLVAPMLNAMEVNRSESHTLSNQRDALLPKLMSGELRASKVSADYGSVS